MDPKEVTTIELVPLGEANLVIVIRHPLLVDLVESPEHVIHWAEQHAVQGVGRTHEEHLHGVLVHLEPDGDVLAAVELRQLLPHPSAAPDPRPLLRSLPPLPQPVGVVQPDAVRRPLLPLTPVSRHSLLPVLVVPGGSAVGARVVRAV